MKIFNDFQKIVEKNKDLLSKFMLIVSFLMRGYFTGIFL